LLITIISSKNLQTEIEQTLMIASSPLKNKPSVTSSLMQIKYTLINNYADENQYKIFRKFVAEAFLPFYKK
jgi:hypothetical protein